MFKGSIVALITPFKNNKLDEECYISFFFAVIVFVSWSTEGLGTGSIRSAANPGDTEKIENIKIKTLSLNKFFINF